jgi:hypothetical protein
MLFIGQTDGQIFEEPIFYDVFIYFRLILCKNYFKNIDES